MNDDSSSKAKFETFHALHVPGAPLILFNAWDAGSARAVAEAGAPAVATGSWSVAAAQGYADGEDLPLDASIANAARIVAAVDLPVSVDFEGGYAEAAADVGANGRDLAATGAVGCNFEDRLVRGDGLHTIVAQADRISALAAVVGGDFFINARTDLFLSSKAQDHASHLDAAIERAQAYARAGARGFFAPGLTDIGLIARLCEASQLPVNIMAFPGVPETAALADAGVARISHGPGPYRLAMAALTEAARVHYPG